MITIAVHFLAGRYHATPWGSHVNEGLVEWPPNPWRLLRALIATGFAKLRWSDIPDDARRVVLKLAEALPDYHLPRGQVAHTRHYMPNGSFHTKQKNIEATDKVLDTFVRLRHDKPLLVRWQLELLNDELALLDKLVSEVSYLGRAESWADLSLFEGDVPAEGWTCPSNGEGAPLGGDQVALLAAQQPGAYARWREPAIESALEVEEKNRGKALTKSQRTNITAKFPADLLECLTTDTEFLQKHGWNQPPGSQRVLYNRPDSLARLPQHRSRRHRSPFVDTALLALSSDSVRGDRLPRVTRAVRQGEFIHQALVSIVNKQLKVRDCAVLTGRDEDGNKLMQVHQHAHYFPLDLDDDRRIDHVLIFAPAGLDAAAQQAVTRLRRTWTKGDDTDIFVTCAGFGELDLFRRQLRHRDGRAVAMITPRPWRTWISFTPYVPARHLKPKNNRYTVIDDVIRELGLRALPQPKHTKVLDSRDLVDRQFFKYVRKRIDGKPQPPQPNVYAVRLEFEEPQLGPLALGYGSHFGLGVFAADVGRPAGEK